MTTPWRNRIIGTGTEDPEQLLANPLNWRLHPGPQRDALRDSLDAVGWVATILVNQRSGFVIDGHARIEEALGRHEKTVPVTYVDLSPEEEALVLASLDPITAMADRDAKRLDELVAGIGPQGPGLQALLDSLRLEVPKTGQTDSDDIPEARADPGVKLGDLFTLGDHRILCGDCTKPEDVARLTAGAIADIIWTDPPYGVNYVGKTKSAMKIDNDEINPAQTRALVADSMKLAPLKPGGVFYIAAPSGYEEFLFRQGLEEAGLRLHQVIAWVKDRFVMGRSDYHWRHESILYGWKEGVAHYFIADRTQDTVWEIPRPSASEDHPTQKPIELVTRALVNSSHPGEIVYDPFCGSGTTIIAAESLGRRCLAMELDPVYVRVAIDRWEANTGRHSDLLS
jgi:DNA modification methylase